MRGFITNQLPALPMMPIDTLARYFKRSKKWFELSTIIIRLLVIQPAMMCTQSLLMF